MAAQRPLLRGQRLKTPGQMKAFVKDAVGLHLGGQYPYVNIGDLVDALNAADPNGKTWNRQRLDYHKGEIRKKMVAEQRRPAERRQVETSPSDADLMEGFGVGYASGGLDMTGFDVEQLPEATGAAEDHRRRRTQSAAAQLAQPSRRRVR